MKTTVVLLAVLLLGTGCSSRPPEETRAAPAVAVSIAPLATMASALLGDTSQVLTVLAPGESPATFDPGPRRMAVLEGVRVYFACGVPMENQLLPRLRQGRPELAIVDVTAGIDRVPLDAHRHSHDSVSNDEPEETDPHLWLDPGLMNSQVRVMAARLETLFPDRAAEIVARADSLAAELEALDRRLADILAPVRGRDLFVFHPAFGYLARAYGLRQVAIEQGGLDPTPRHLARVLRQVREQGARAVFVQPQFSLGSARAVARDTGVEIVVLDPLAPDYAENMIAMAQAIREALDDRE